MGLNKPSCTSKACEWNQAFKKCVTPAKAADIKTGLSSASTKRKRTAVLTAAPVTPQVKSQMQSELLRFSKQHKSVYMTSVDESGTASGSSDMPFPLSRVCFMGRAGVHDAASVDFCEEFFDRLPLMYANTLHLRNLEERTREQSRSKLWHDHRHCRVTASMFGDVMAHVRSGKASPSLIDRVVERGTVVSAKRCPKPLLWGREHESEAIELAVSALTHDHPDVRHEPVGLVVRGDYPHLGATPDGVITCSCDGCPRKRLIEVKCPFAMRDDEPSHAACLDADGQLLESHKYYAQVQGQLFIADIDECIFVVYTEKGAHIAFVQRNHAYIANMLHALRAFYVREVLPVLLSA